jgi:hypothetical protein
VLGAAAAAAVLGRGLTVGLALRPPLALACGTYGALTETAAVAGAGRKAAVAAKSVWKRRHSRCALALSWCGERERELG